MRNKRNLMLISVLVALLAACTAVPRPEASYDPAALRFSGEQAFATETEFVTNFPYRHSGQTMNRVAADWLLGEFEALGLDCEMQEWSVINYSLPIALNNVACTLPGESPKQILIVAHHDQAPTTTQGADNDGSGIAILLQLAGIFASEGTPPYTLTFVSTDAEEYGMLGTYHYVQTHPNPDEILVGMSLDNLGREYYDGMSIELIGQYRNYGPIWVPLAAQAAAEAGGLWPMHLRATLDQVLDQAGPISFMDQGPMIAAGIPAIGLTGHVPVESGGLHYQLWHDPDDTTEHQSAETLGNAGLVAEAFVRQLLSTDEFPRQFGPYLYFEESGQIFNGLPLWAIFVAFVALFFAASHLVLRVPWKERLVGWREALPHLLSLWLPLLASIVLTYVFVAVGIMDQYDVYPATSKDLHIYNPRWEAVVLFLAGLAVFLWLGRWLAAKYGGGKAATLSQRKSLAFLMIGMGALYVLLISPFSLLFLAPTFFWLLIAGRKGIAGKSLDVVFFLLGGLVFYGLFYFFGFVIYDYGFAFAWFMLMMFSIQMTSFWTAAVITVVVGAGLSLLVPQARVEARKLGTKGGRV
ncbi:MAG: M28 family peptidase [Anaerolineales bacterium]